MTTQQKLGRKVKKFRIERAWTQEKLAELTNLDRTYISDIERGVRNPSIKSIEKLAHALKIKTADLV